MPRMTAGKRSELESFWRAHLDGWRRSDLNQREYCALHGLPLKRFGNWRAQLKHEESASAGRLLIRPVALGRKNHFFAGSDGGAERWATVGSLIATAKLNDVEPYAYLKDVLERMVDGHPVNRLDDLLPWNWSPTSSTPDRRATPGRLPCLLARDGPVSSLTRRAQLAALLTLEGRIPTGGNSR